MLLRPPHLRFRMSLELLRLGVEAVEAPEAGGAEDGDLARDAEAGGEMLAGAADRPQVAAAIGDGDERLDAVDALQSLDRRDCRALLGLAEQVDRGERQRI